MITWQDFENTVANPKNSFEDLSRIFFKYHYIKDLNAVVPQRANNPGIETEPILIDGKRVGFQSKYFSSNISYSDILESAEMTIKYYNGKIDKVVLFCNKDISLVAENYKKTKALLNKNSIEIELCCNNNILDPINTNENYHTIKSLFFGKLSLSNEWFFERLSQTLKELEPRYTSGFHVETEDQQNYFEFLYRSEQVKDILRNIIIDAKKEIRRLTGIKIIDRIEEVIDQFVIPERDSYQSIFNWSDSFSEIKEEILSQNEELDLKKKQYYDGELDIKEEEYRAILRKSNDYSRLLGIIESFDFNNNPWFRCLKNNFLIVEGNAGKGKSHLLGYEAELHGNSKECRSILLLGHKFVLQETPQNQIMKLLGREDISFNTFLDACEGEGELSGCITVIMIDAINECQDSNVWRGYLNQIIQLVQKYKYVRLVCSIRSTYKEYFFDEALANDIKIGKIPLVKVVGFENVLTNAIPLFFEYYNIPIEISDYFNYEFKDPLFLKTYCEAYRDRTTHRGSAGIYELYRLYIQKEEKKVRLLKNIIDDINYGSLIINIIGEYFYQNETNKIPYIELIKRAKVFSDEAKIFIDAFLKAKVLISYMGESGQKNVFLNYERFSDYVTAKYIIDSTSNLSELVEFVDEKILQLDEYGWLKNHFGIARFAAISVLAYEKYGVEIINEIKILKDEEIKRHTKENIVTEYLEAVKYRADKHIKVKDYFEDVTPYITTQDTFEKHLELMLSMAGRDCELNANVLTDWLKKMSLTERDHSWTCYINSQYYEGSQIYYIIQFFIENNLSDLDISSKVLYGQALTWLLTSSNRTLRDKASRAIVQLLKNDLKAIIELLNLFIDVNDPYIVSRLMGCFYGAILLSGEKKLIIEDYKKLTTLIYNKIFAREIVYPDILLRDYALNILEYALSKNIALDFDIEKCRPPYNSCSIPDISTEEIKSLYRNEQEGWSGLKAIELSMAPEYGIKDFCGGYGDFGRYTFESSLRCFKNLDMERAFKYAYYYIVKDLKYNNELFSEHDSHIGYGRSRENSIERIGKKYQWITMYHILALVADNYEYKEEYSDLEISGYKGTWRPYVRDFDPTLTICTNKPNYELGIKLYREEYKAWDITNPDWAKTLSGEEKHRELVEIKDQNDESWCALYFSITDESGRDAKKARQSLWRSAMACLIKKEEQRNFIEKIKEKNFYGRWFEAAESGNHYNIFLREYAWSPAYKDEIGGEEFVSAEIEGVRRKVKRKVPKFNWEKLIQQSADENIPISFFIEEEEREVEEVVNETIGHILPCYNFYLWEEECDYGKYEAISLVLPTKYIVDKLKLIQVQDGVWSKDGEIACVDFSLVKEANLKSGLYLKKKFLEQLLGTDLAIVWIGLGEKQHLFDGWGMESGQVWNELSSLIYYDENGNLVEVNHSSAKDQERL